MKKIFSFILSSMFCVLYISSQNINNNWYLNGRKYYDFNEEKIIKRLDTTFYSNGLSSTISDKNGDLLFTLNSNTILNRDGKVMPNGDNLKGDFPITEETFMPVISLKHSKRENIYFVFSVSSKHNNPLFNDGGKFYYSIVDMNLDNGYGNIVTGKKNIYLGEGYASLLTVAQGLCDNYWLVLHEANTNIFHSYEIQGDSIFKPVISEVGSALNSLKTITNYTTSFNRNASFSPNFNYLQVNFNEFIEYYSFDKSTGKLSNPKKVIDPLNELIIDSYFLNENSIVYLVDRLNTENAFENRKLLKYNFPKNSFQEIDSFSEQSISNISLYNNKLILIDVIRGKLTTSTSKKMLIYDVYPNSFSKPTKVDLESDDSGLNNNTIELKEQKRNLLPNDSTFCTHDYRLYLTDKYDFIKWNNSVTRDTLVNDKDGFQTVEASVRNCTWYDTIDVSLINLPSDFLGNDTIVCDSFLWKSNIDFDVDILWSNGETSHTATIKNSGEYSAILKEETCQSFDTINVKIIKTPNSVLSNDTSICKLEDYELDLSRFDNIEWADGNIDMFRTFEAYGEYGITATYQGCEMKDSFILNYDSECNFIGVPNIFSPNGDNENDIFKPFLSDALTYEFKVFDRWGTLVFETQNPTVGWDGNYKGKRMPTENYLFTILWMDWNGRELFESGVVQLVR